MRATSAALMAALRAHGRAFGDLAADALADGANPFVPACPDLTARELVRHVGAVHEVMATWVADGRRPNDRWRAPADGSRLADWQQERFAALLDVLDARDPLTPCSTWSAHDRTVAFWIRRATHETAIHHLDLAQAVDVAWTTEATVAVDGLAEALDLWLGTLLGRDVGGSGRAVRLVIDAAPGRAPALDRVVRPLHHLVEHTPGAVAPRADATITGSAAALYAWAWGRDDGKLRATVHGDAHVVVELRGLLARTQQ